MAYVFLDNNGIISHPLVGKEVRLNRSNEEVQMWFDPIDNDFGNKLVIKVS